MMSSIRALNDKVSAFAMSFPLEGMAQPGWTNREVKRALERIGCGLGVSNSEYVIAMGYFRRSEHAIATDCYPRTQK